MLKPSTFNLQPSTAHTDTQIIAACREAATAEVNYAFKALVAGQMLAEKRDALARTCHDGKSSIHGRNQHTDDGENFGAWLDSVEIASRTAYRWMDCADRVLRSQLGLNLTDPRPVCIEVGGEVIPHSALLSMPDEQAAALPEAARTLRQGVLDFMEDKTLGEAARAAFADESPAHRISRAGNGRQRGGTNDRDNRKDWPKFARRHIHNLTAAVANFDSCDDDQTTDIGAAFAEAVKRWPQGAVEMFQSIIKNEIASRRGK